MKNKKNSKNNKNKYTIHIVIILTLALLVTVYKLGFSNKESTASDSTQINSSVETLELKIAKKDVSDKVKFYPFNAEGTYMEVLAVKATDGTIRTALNTCQVCYNSGRGYYKQQGNTVVCQNCGNVFGIDDIEVVKGGCNPVPIFEENKTDDGENIAISTDFLISNKEYFARWKK